MESTLSLKRTDLEGEIGVFAGWGRGEDNGDTAWSKSEKDAIQAAVRSGLRQFYVPEPLDDSCSHNWSFLSPTVTVTLASGKKTVALPDDFGFLDGDVTLATTTASMYEPLQPTGEGRINQAYAMDQGRTGCPVLICVQPVKGTTPTSGQRFQLYVYPTAEQAYSLTFGYQVLADALSGDRPYAYGGMLHAETILAACKMAFEESLNDTLPGQGVWSVKFRSRLAASIDVDRRQNPQFYGPNRDNSDERERWTRWYTRGRESIITYNGVTPT